jgi:hypothetical protein
MHRQRKILTSIEVYSASIEVNVCPAALVGAGKSATSGSSQP